LLSTPCHIRLTVPLKRISKLYDIEREIAGKSADIRHAARLTSN
jgi:hypothetical protein